MLLRIEGVDLPGRAPHGSAQANVHVGIQRRDEVISLVPADAETAAWEVEVVTKDGPDFGGPFIHGRRGARFVYLSWGSVGPDGGFHSFRRAKIHPADAGAELVASAIAGPGVLVVRLGLTDAKGGPVCATVRPPLVTWSVR
jgi:hypothetical protein